MAYYAGRGNAFWRTLHAVGLTPRQFAPEEFRDLIRYGLGLTDLVKTLAGNDRKLSAADFDLVGLRKKILEYQPRTLAFTSKRAAQAFLRRKVNYGLQADEAVEATGVFVLPSPAGTARRYWDERLWRDLAHIRSSNSLDPRAS